MFKRVYHLTIFFGFVSVGLSVESYAQTRYSIFTGAALGNAKNLGMSGATTGLADHYSGALSNPAGPAMTLAGSEFSVLYAELTNSLLKNTDSKHTYTELGTSIPLSWGGGVTLSDSFSFAATDPSGETISVRDYGVTLSQRLLGDRLSLGVAALVGVLSTRTENLSAWDWRLGAVYRLPHQVFLGASYRFPQEFRPDSRNRVFTTPGVLSLGVSWMVNRFFKAAFDIRSIGSQDQTYLVHLPQEQTGLGTAFQYHLGIDYQFISLKGLDAYFYAGTYLENTRTSLGSRQHYTWGVELLPLFFQISAGKDVSSGYNNTQFRISLNLSFILKNLPIYPPSVKGPSGGVLPNPLRRSEDWLMTHVQDHPEDSFQVIDPEVSDFASPIKKNKAVKEDQNIFERLFQIIRE